MNAKRDSVSSSVVRPETNDALQTRRRHKQSVRDQRAPSTADGGRNTYRSGGCVCVNCAYISHAHITTAAVGVSPFISGRWSPSIPASQSVWEGINSQSRHSHSWRCTSRTQLSVTDRPIEDAERRLITNHRRSATVDYPISATLDAVQVGSRIRIN